MVSSDKGLVTFKGLQEGFQDTPLKKFKGKLVDYDTKEQTGQWPGMRIQLKFDGVEVIESTEPYHFPIAEISVKYSDRKSSAWGVFATSADKIVPDCDILDLVGKVITMQRSAHRFGIKDRETGEDVITECWEVVEIEGAEPGVGVKSPVDKALSLLDGKPETEWNTLVLSDSVVKGSAELVSSILGKTFLPAMETAGKVSKDADGIWHVVEGE